MAELRLAFEEMGFEEVATYIASGNVLVVAPRRGLAEIAAEVEAALSSRFGVELKVVLLTGAQLRKVVEQAPEGFGGESHLCDVIFLRKPLTPKKALAVIETKDGVDSVWTGPGVLYYSRLAAKASSSRISRFASLPEYKNATIRSWRTTTKLLALID